MNNPSTTKNWLDELKERSWEAELLISAIAIYGSIQAFGLTDNYTNFLINQFPESQYMVIYMLSIMAILGLGVLSSLFIIHFILRAYWIGLVGLNSVYSDYDFDSSAYSKVYTEKMVKILPKLSDTIQSIDRLSSVIFSIAFSAFFTYGWFCIISTVFLFLTSSVNNPIVQVATEVVYIALGAIFVIHILISILANIPKFKGVHVLQVTYFYSSLIGNFIMLGPLFKLIMQIMMMLGTNYKKDKKLVWILFFTFILSAVMLMVVVINKKNMTYLILYDKLEDDKELYSQDRFYTEFYASQNQDMSMLLTPEISNDRITDSVFTIFIPIFRHELRDIKVYCPDFEKKKKPHPLVLNISDATMTITMSILTTRRLRLNF